jgi:diadenosine tetraphosphate (Ap4A) HIT family hydrolase
MSTATVSGETAIHRRVAACRAGTEPTVIARVASGWVVLGDPQVLHGYCLLLPDPVVPHLNALPSAAQQAFLADLARLGDALLAVTGAVRINYAIFGNVEPALHAHAFPRYADEPRDLVKANPWGYDWTVAPRFDAAAHDGLIRRIRAALPSGREP